MRKTGATGFLLDPCAVFFLAAQMLDGDVLASLVATAGKHVPAALGLHSLAEAVHLGMGSLFGLVCSFHVGSFLKKS